LPRAALTRKIEHAAQQVSTRHHLRNGDARKMDFLTPASVDLVPTSPPYWTLKEYDDAEGQLGDIGGYEAFLDELDKVWRDCFDALVPGGRLICVVGDVCLSRRRNLGVHEVVPLHASIQERCRRIGFTNLAPIIWHKIANAAFESSGNGGGFLGKPYEPNAVIKNDIECILMLRKPGGYRTPTAPKRLLSVIPEALHRAWFQQVWTGLTGASTREHPAPYPVELAERLVRMFSFVGDTVLDPFMGTGTTAVAAAKWGAQQHRRRDQPRVRGTGAPPLRARCEPPVLGRRAGDCRCRPTARPGARGGGVIRDLEAAIDGLLSRPATSTLRLQDLADLLKSLLDRAGLPGVRGGSSGELSVPGLSRPKNWDIAYEFAGKFRLLVSLKSMLKNISGSVPNRIDDLQSELANVQQLRSEIVIGYVVLLDVVEDKARKEDGEMWSDWFEQALRRLAIRKAPLWNPGLMEGLWFIRFDGRRASGERLVDPTRVEREGGEFIRALLCELQLREPAVELRQPLDCNGLNSLAR